MSWVDSEDIDALREDRERLNFLERNGCAIAYDEGEWKVSPRVGPGGAWSSELRQAIDSIRRLWELSGVDE